MPRTNEREWEKEFDDKFCNPMVQYGWARGEHSSMSDGSVKAFIRQLELDTIARCANIAKSKIHWNDGDELGYPELSIRNAVCEDIATAITSLNKTI